MGFIERLARRLKDVIKNKEDEDILMLFLEARKLDKSEIEKRAKTLTTSSILRIMDTYKDCTIGALVETVTDLERRLSRLENIETVNKHGRRSKD